MNMSGWSTIGNWIGSGVKATGNQLSVQAQYDSDMGEAYRQKFLQYQAENNAQMTAEQAVLVGEKAKIEERNVEIATRARVSAARGGAAAGGTLVGEGSNLDYEVNIEQGGALQRAAVRSDAAQAQWALGVERQNYLAQASQHRRASSQIKSAAKQAFWGGTLGIVGGEIQTVAGSFGSFGGK